jgi:hypothetical protein
VALNKAEEGKMLRRCSKVSGMIECRDLGELRHVVVAQDNLGTSPAWHCSLVCVRDTSVNLTVYFYCNMWWGEVDEVTCVEPKVEGAFSVPFVCDPMTRNIQLSSTPEWKQPSRSLSSATQ